MTETQSTRRPVPPIGLTVGIAQAALTELLAGVLEQAGTSRETYLAFQRLSSLEGAGPLGLDAYARDLSRALQVGEPAAAALAAQLESDGLITVTDSVVAFSAQGATLRDRLRRSVGESTAELLAPIDPGDLETTSRTLEAITARARAISQA
jgi:DNA-binding MarR family transcriptional regulator